MTDRELMQQALETLMDAQLHNYALKHKETNDLIADLRERLADNTIHSCSYYCERPECVKAQRDELRELLAGGKK